MVKIKSSAQIDAAYKGAIGRVAAAYKQGVEGTTNWQENAVKSEALYAQKLQEAISAGRRAKALGQVTNEEWKRKASNLGSQRIGPGMQENADKRARNFEPYRAAIEGTVLPERTADPMQNVQQRVGGIVQALVNTKRQVKG